MKKRYPSKHVLILLFLSLRILFIEMGLAQNSTAYVGVNVGVVLDLECFDVNIALSCIIVSLSDFYMPLTVTTKPGWTPPLGTPRVFIVHMYHSLGTRAYLSFHRAYIPQSKRDWDDRWMKALFGSLLIVWQLICWVHPILLSLMQCMLSYINWLTWSIILQKERRNIEIEVAENTGYIIILYFA